MSTANHGSILDSTGTPRGYHFKYQTVKGYFIQSEDDTNDEEFDFKKQNFGLIDRPYDTDQLGEKETLWRRFDHHVRSINLEAPKNIQYKVLFLGRHGQGYHNIAESRYGTKAWDCYWSMLNGADGITWADAKLTSIGQQQALDVHELWKEQLPKGIPSPETYYVSPLTRAIETADSSFMGLELPEEKAYRPLIKELLREAIGVHTCDRRSTKSYIEKMFPHVTLEPSFSERDPLWEADYREPRSARKYRLEKLLDDIFINDSNVFLSLTSHSGAIGSILEAIGHRKFALETGGVIPVFVKAERVDGQREQPPKEPSEGPGPGDCDGYGPPKEVVLDGARR